MQEIKGNLFLSKNNFTGLGKWLWLVYVCEKHLSQKFFFCQLDIANLKIYKILFAKKKIFACCLVSCALQQKFARYTKVQIFSEFKVL